MALSYYCLIEDGYHFKSISLWHTIPFISLLNSSTKSLLLYLLSLTTLLNFWTNSFIVLPLYYNLFNSTIFTISLSPLLKSFFISTRNSPTISYSNKPSSKSSNVFSFQTSTDPSYTYNRIY